MTAKEVLYKFLKPVMKSKIRSQRIYENHFSVLFLDLYLYYFFLLSNLGLIYHGRSSGIIKFSVNNLIW